MRCGDYAAPQVLVGLYRVGIVGLRQACSKVAASGLTDRERIVDALFQELETDNYVTDGQLDEYRIALWREYLRSRGRDFSDFFSVIQVTVRGDPGEDRDRLIELCRSVFADFELQPEIETAPPDQDAGQPELVIGDSSVARGLPTRKALKATIRRRLSDW